MNTSIPTMSDRPNLFPTLGEIAGRTNDLPDVSDDDARLKDDARARGAQDEGEEREMQEIESLCMRCHEQVSVTRIQNYPWRYAD